MSCNTRFWQGLKTAAPERLSNSALATENKSALSALMAAREAQDKRWNYASADQDAGASQSTERKASLNVK